jgi:hypothetical protein
MTQAIIDRYADINEAASELRIHPMSLRRLAREGKVPGVRRLPAYGHEPQHAGVFLFDRAALAAFKAAYDPRPGRKPVRRLI